MRLTFRGLGYTLNRRTRPGKAKRTIPMPAYRMLTIVTMGMFRGCLLSRKSSSLTCAAHAAAVTGAGAKGRMRLCGAVNRWSSGSVRGLHGFMRVLEGCWKGCMRI